MGGKARPDWPDLYIAACTAGGGTVDIIMEILLLRYKAEYLSNIPTLGPASLSLYQHYLPLCLFINITNWTLKHTNHWDFIKTEIADRLTQWSLLSDCYKAVSDDTEKKVT